MHPLLFFVLLLLLLLLLLRMCRDGADEASPNVMILVLARLLLGPNLEASASKMVNPNATSF